MPLGKFAVEFAQRQRPAISGRGIAFGGDELRALKSAYHPVATIGMVLLAMLCYILLFAMFYSVLGVYATFPSSASTCPSPYASSISSPSGTPSVLHCPIATLYFSAITLSTVGYGDYIPATDLCRFFAAFEALSGYLFLVMLIAAVVNTLSKKRATNQID